MLVSAAEALRILKSGRGTDAREFRMKFRV